MELIIDGIAYIGIGLALYHIRTLEKRVTKFERYFEDFNLWYERKLEEIEKGD